MPTRRRKKPPDPTPLFLPFTCLSKKSTSVLELHLLGHIGQFIHLGKIVGLTSISGFNLPCSGLSCSNLGNYSSRPWSFPSLDRSASGSLVLGSDVACCGCGRTLSPLSVPIVWSSEPGSASVTRNAPGRLAGLRVDGCIGVPLFPLLRGSSCGTV